MNQQTCSSKRSQAIVNVYLILKKEDSFLLSLRKNTGYLDGYYGLVAGHVEENESALHAVIREAEEEIGVNLDPNHLVFKGMIHRKTDRNNVDLFFECTSWLGEIENREPHKCGALFFFKESELPQNSIPYIKEVVLGQTFTNGYADQGFNLPP